MSLSDEFDRTASRPVKRTHRGRRSKGKGPKPDHMAQANQHIDKAKADPTPKGTTAHLFRALSSLKRAAKDAPESSGNALL